jgi:predicted MFS family arabinose efflux permease
MPEASPSSTRTTSTTSSRRTIRRRVANRLRSGGLAAASPARRLFLNRDFQLLWVGETLSELGSQSSAVAYPLLVLALSGSPARAGIVGLAKWLPLTIFSLPAGVLVDRVDRKRLMICCDAVRLAGAASIVLTLVLAHPTFAQIVAVAFLDGGLSITSYIAERGALRQVVAADQLPDAVAANEARVYAAGIIGPSLGGALFAGARALPFLADALSFTCSTAAIAATRTSFGRPRERSSEPPLRELMEGFAWLRAHPFYRATALLFAVGNPMFTGLALLAILLARHDHASAATIGLMLTIGSAGGLLGAVFAGPVRRSLSTRAVIAVGPWLALAVVLLLLVVHVPLLIGVLLAVSEFAAPATNAAVAGSRVAAAPDHLQGRVQAAASMLSMSLAWLGPLAVGIVFQQGGGTATILALAAWTAALALGATCTPSIRHHSPGATPVAAQDV